MRIALATAAYLPHASEDDQVLIAAMRSAGLQPVPVVWDAPARWHDYDAIVLRSIWDYHLKYGRFLEWLAELDASGVPVHNSTRVVRWNADKRYLLELERHGVRITPSRLSRHDDGRTLRDISQETGWRHLVIKPTVASTGYETWMTDAPVGAEEEARFAAQKSRMDLLVQEFAAGVHTGELSMVFLQGAYSHSVLKRAAGSEFRVHAEHGGTVEPAAPTAAQVAWGETVLAAVAEPWTYARVDAVNDEVGPMLMELELLDPELFFNYNQAAATRLIEAVTATTNVR